MKKIFSIGFGLLLLAGCATKHRDTRLMAPSAVSSPTTDLLVISAVYGSGTKFADVTPRVNELLHQPDVEFFARPEWLRTDPTPGWNKALVIVYEFKKQRRIFTTGEGGKVSVKCLLEKSAKKTRKKK